MAILDAILSARKRGKRLRIENWCGMPESVLGDHIDYVVTDSSGHNESVRVLARQGDLFLVEYPC